MDTVGVDNKDNTSNKKRGQLEIKNKIDKGERLAKSKSFIITIVYV